MSLPPIILDISALLYNAEVATPAGIPRVELAYAKHLIATARERLSFVAYWGRLGAAPVDAAVALVELLDAIWSGRRIEPDARAEAAAIARSLRRHLALRGDRSSFTRGIGGGERPVYVSVSNQTMQHRWALQRIKQRGGARVVCLVHDLIGIEFPNFVPSGRMRRQHRRMANIAEFADVVIVNSAATGNSFRRRYEPAGFRAPILVAPLGIDLWSAGSTGPPSIEGPYFLYIGTIEPRKNHLLLLDVWNRLVAELGARTPRLVLIGRRGWKGREITDAIYRSAILRGFVAELNGFPDSELVKYLRGARALLFPSRAEGYGLPLAEALAFGVPVISSDIEALREVGQGVPDYLDPDDVSGWQTAITDYLPAESRRRQQQLARLDSWQPPSWEEHFRKVEAIIDG